MNENVREKSTADERSIAEIVGEFAAHFQYDSVPQPVRDRAKHLMLDGIGIAFASTKFDFAQQAYPALVLPSGTEGSRVIGFRGRMELRDAVLFNGMLVHGLDYDDTYFAGGIHPTASSLPVALGVAQACNASGRDCLTAYVLAMEVATRLASVAQGALNQVGIHPSSLLAPFSSAVATGWLMKLNAHQLTMAQGIALGMAGGTLESLQDGSWTKRIQPGAAAACGITAARLAAKDFVGSVRAYEGRFGLFPAHLGPRVSECDYSAATAGLGTAWEVMRVALKPHPACHATQAPIEAAIEIANNSNLDPREIESITAIVPPYSVKLVCEPIEQRRRPKSSYGAQFSLPYTIACAFIRRRFGLEEIKEEAFTDESILELARKVSYRVDETFTVEQFKTSRSAALVVRTTDGREFSHKVTASQGSLDNPLSSSEIVAKFMDNARTVMRESRATQLKDRVLGMESIGSALEIGKLLGE